MRAFPIMLNDFKGKEYIPFEVIEPHESQALKNHGQTLERLAERGGLSYDEALLVLTDKQISSPVVEQDTAKAKVLQIVEDYKRGQIE